MRKFVSVLTVLAFLLTVVGCNSGSSGSSAAPASPSPPPAASGSSADPTSPPPAASVSSADPTTPTDSGTNRYQLTSPINIRVATAGSGSVDYVDMGVIVTFLAGDNVLPAGSNITQETILAGASGAGYMVEAGMTDLCRGQNAISATVGLNGRDPFKDVYALFGAGSVSCVLQVATQSFVNKSGYSTIEEILENKYPATIVTEDIGSSDYSTISYVFEMYGLTFNDFTGWGGRLVHTDNNSASEMLQDGTADYMFCNTTLQSSLITELTMSTNVVLSGLSDKLTDGLLERGFAERYIPVGTYGQFPEETRTAYIGTSLIVHKDMPNEVAYCLTKILMDNRPDLGEQTPTMRNLTYKIATDTKITVVPLHPGAVEYYQDVGVMDANGNYLGEGPDA